MNASQARTLARFHLDVAHAHFRAREEAGLSVDSVAQRAGLSPDRVLMIEEGDTTSLTEVAQLCLAMGIGIGRLFSEQEDALQPAGAFSEVAR